MASPDRDAERPVEAVGGVGVDKSFPMGFDMLSALTVVMPLSLCLFADRLAVNFTGDIA